MTRRKMFFCYERNMLGKWEPVVYYDDVPTLNAGGKESAPLRSILWPVLEDCRENDEPHFGKLQEMFKAPA